MRSLDRKRVAAALVAAGLAGHAFFLPVSIAGMQIGLGVAAAGLLLDLPRPLRTPLDLPVAAFVLVAIASDLWSPYGAPELSQATLWRAAAGFFVVAHGIRLLPEGAPRRLVYFACAGLALSSLVGLVQYRTGIDLVYMLHLRAQPAAVAAPGVPGRYGAMGFFTSRLTFGHCATVLLALLAGLMAQRTFPRRQSIFVAAAGLLGLAAVAVTFDRAAWLGLCAAAFTVALFAAPRARKAVLPVLLLLGAGAALDPAVRLRFASAFSSRANPDRMFIWARALEIIRDHPLRGIGFANYQRALGPYYDRVDPHFIMRTWAHNLELSTLAETGPLGLLTMLYLWTSAAAALFRRRALGGLAALAAWLVIAQMHDVFYDTKVMYSLWFALGLSLSPDATVLQQPPPARAG